MNAGPASAKAPSRFTWTSRIMMRQIAGSFAQYEKARLVRKLREARERSGKLGGRKSYAEARSQSNYVPRVFRTARSRSSLQHAVT